MKLPSLKILQTKQIHLAAQAKLFGNLYLPNLLFIHGGRQVHHGCDVWPRSLFKIFPNPARQGFQEISSVQM